MIFVITNILKLIKNVVNLYSNFLSMLASKKDYTKPFLFYLLFIANLLFLSKYHNIFIYNAGEYSPKHLITMLSASYINLFIKPIITINWILGFSFLPSLPFLIQFFKNLEYMQFLNMMMNVIALDMLLALINKGGAIGSVFFYYLSWPLVLSFSILLLSIGNFFAFRKKKKVKPINRIKTAPSVTQSMLPSLNLLTIGEKVPISNNIEEQKKTLMQTLQDFGIKAKIIDVVIGPVVTLYSVELAAGIKSVRLINLDEDIARSMQAFSTRIATIPGKNLIGIEIANKKRQTVYFKEGLKTEKYQNFDGNLPLYLGANIYGEHEVFDLAQMPHLLVAGTTGSGKSVGLHTMLLSILYKRLPDELKLILIDPKKLELTPYEDIPHLLLPIITEPKKAISSLKWTVEEMETRYRKMAKLGVRNILTYNIKMEKNKQSDEKLPFIVIIIDEIADLMLTAGKEIELYIQRLAQMGRACGIHIITATQRPSVDVITGTIKANFPTRISFKLASKIDSRTILGDLSGAEQLLGAGDMLFLSTNGQLQRIHGSFVSEEDVIAVVDFWKKQAEPKYIELQEEQEQDSSIDSSNEPYYKQAVELIRSTQKVSTSFLQRNFPIGYNRAAKIIEQMEKDGIISRGDKFGRNREIL